MKIEGRPYEFRIIGADSKAIEETEKGYAGLRHGEHYKIEMENLSSEDASAEIKVDGVSVGNFAIDHGQTMVLERPSDIAKLFTFYKKGSEEAKASLLNKVSENNLGLIEIKFVPGEIIRSMPRKALFMFDLGPMKGGDFSSGATRGGFGAGGTGLSGHSAQRFTTVQFNGDETRAVTLRLRLVHDPKRGLTPDVQPLSGHLPNETPTPPPVGKTNRRKKPASTHEHDK